MQTLTTAKRVGAQSDYVERTNPRRRLQALLRPEPE
jgi:hypothetical protein